MEFQEITAMHVNRIKEVIRKYDLKAAIHLNLPAIGGVLEADQTSVVEKSPLFTDMDVFYLLRGEDSKVIEIKGRKYELFINIGEWGYKTNIPAAHISVGTYPVKFGSSYFCQIELSQALIDGDGNIIIVKNMSRLAGNGAMSRLNKGACSTEKKRARRLVLKKKLAANTLIYGGHEWLELCRIGEDELYNLEKGRAVFQKLVEGIVRLAFAVEEIIAVDEAEDCFG